MNGTGSSDKVRKMKEETKYMQVSYNEEGEIKKEMSTDSLLWGLVGFWIIPFYAIVMLIYRGFKGDSWIKEVDYHKRKIKELTLK